MDANLVFPLLSAGALAGVVNFFSNYVNLPLNKPANLDDNQPIALKDIWWVALAGYIIVAGAGAFLTPLINAITSNSLKGLEWLTATGIHPPPNGYNLVVLFGYGLVFGYSATKLLVSLLDSLMKKVTALEYKVTSFQQLENRPLLVKTIHPAAHDIIDKCNSQFDAFKSDCSGFVRAVAAAFSITLIGQANDIVTEIQQDQGWVQLGKDGVAAKGKAVDGWLVIGGLAGEDNDPPQEHGHVVVVVSGPLAQGKYPTAFWGKLNGVGEKNKTINWAWNSTSRDNVIYAAQQVS